MLSVEVAGFHCDQLHYIDVVEIHNYFLNIFVTFRGGKNVRGFFAAGQFAVGQFGVKKNVSFG